MLVGRQAVRGRFLVDPGRSFFGERDQFESWVRSEPGAPKGAEKGRRERRATARPRRKKR